MQESLTAISITEHTLLLTNPVKGFARKIRNSSTEFDTLIIIKFAE